MPVTHSTSFVYTPESPRVNAQGAIEMGCGDFKSHENGIPELIKNSADELVVRLGLEPQRRVILLIFYSGTKSQPASVSCLDFGGMTSRVIDEDFMDWFNKEAARRRARDGQSTQGGHGNGGKCYMTQLFEEHAEIYTVKNGRGCRFGVKAGSLHFGYAPDRANGCDFVVDEVDAELRRALSATGCRVGDLPDVARTALAEATGFTLVRGVSPKGLSSRKARNNLIEDLRSHSQMIRSLEECQVYVMVDGRIWGNGPLLLPDIEPMPGEEEGHTVQVDKDLLDPKSEELVSSTDYGRYARGKLQLRTSKKSMRWGARRSRHTIVFRANGAYIGYVPVSALDIQSAYRDKVYGICTLDALEQYQKNDRGRLAESPLTRSVEEFIADQIRLYVKKFEEKDRREYKKEEKEKLSEMNDFLNKWKDKFLDQYLSGVFGGRGTGGRKNDTSRLPKGTVAALEIAMSNHRSGVGVQLEPKVNFYNVRGDRVRSVDIKWQSDNNNVAMYLPDIDAIQTFSPGTATLSARTADRKIESNKVTLEVVRIEDIRIEPSTLQIVAGGRSKLAAVCRLQDNTEATDVNLIWTEKDPTVARVASAGLVYGLEPGSTEVVCGDDHFGLTPHAAQIEVSEGESGPGDKGGSGRPRVLLSGIDKDPMTLEVVSLSPGDPPVQQRPIDVERNIWWINTSAPWASIFLDENRGYGHDSGEWRVYMFERYVDIIVQIALTSDPDQSDRTINDWISMWSDEVIEIHRLAADDLGAFIHEGEYGG